VIGEQFTSTGPFHRVLDAIEHLQDEARKMGGDALIDLSKDADRRRCRPAGAILGSSEEILNAKVIVWQNAH